MEDCQQGVDGKNMPIKSHNQKDDFDFSLLENFLGYNSSSDKTKLDPRFLIRGSKNVYKKNTGTIASRPGLLRRGATDSTNAGVKSSFEWETSVGTRRHLRVVNGKLEVESDIVLGGTYIWYELFLTSTLASLAGTYTRFVFDAWWDNDEKTDRLLFVRGDDTILHWSGGMALVSSSTANTITKSGTETWAQVGFATQIAGEKKIVIEGREFTYTGGETTTTLTGVTASSGDASTITVGAVAIQAVFAGVFNDEGTALANFKADFIKVNDNQVWLGSYSSRVVWVSSQNSFGGTLGFLLYTQGTTLVTGDPDFVVLDSPAKGIGSKDGRVVIFAGDSDMYVIKPNDDLQISQAAILLVGGTARVVINRVEKKKLPGLQAALGHEFIGNFGEYLVWVDQKNQLRALGTFSTNNVQKPAHLSIQVQEELSEDDFSGGHLRSVEDTIYITSPNNGRDWMYQIREIVNDNGEVMQEKIWQPPQIRGISRFAIFSGVLYGHSNVNPQVYQIWDTLQWYDDYPTDEPIPYNCVARFAYRQLSEAIGGGVFSRRQGLLSFDKIFFEGYMPDGVYLNVNVFYNYQGATAFRSYVINNPEDATEQARFFIGNSAPGFGSSSFGSNPLGDGILEESNEQDTVPKFMRIIDTQNKSCFEYCLEIYSTEPDSRWEILSFGPNVSRASAQPIHIRLR